MIIEVGKRLAEEFPDADVRVPVSGPFSIAVSLRTLGGLLEDVALAPEEVSRFLKQLVESAGQDNIDSLSIHAWGRIPRER